MCFPRQQLSREHAEFLKTRVTGVLSHGTDFGLGIYWFIKMACWCQSHDKNILLTVLRDIVNQVWKKIVFEVQWIIFLLDKCKHIFKVNSEPFLHSFFVFSEVGSLPQVFYWQMDNNNWDCKNTYILGSCAFLVMAGFLKRWGNVSPACILQLEPKHLY